MKAEYNGVKFEGTPSEVVEFLRLVGIHPAPTKTKDDLYNDFVRRLTEQQKDNELSPNPNIKPWVTSRVTEKFCGVHEGTNHHGICTCEV